MKIKKFVGIAAGAALTITGVSLATASTASASTATCNGLPVTIDMNDPNHPNTNRPNSDVILGTPGNDHINTGNGNDVVCLGAGVDFVNSREGFTQGTGYKVYIGGPGENIMDGSSTGTTFHSGPAGSANQFSGGPGNDTYYVNGDDYPFLTVNGGKDRIVRSSGPGRFTLRFGGLVKTGVIVNLLQGWFKVDGVCSAIETDPTTRTAATGTDFADILIGNNADNHLDGLRGADKLYGLGGNDTYANHPGVVFHQEGTEGLGFDVNAPCVDDVTPPVDPPVDPEEPGDPVEPEEPGEEEPDRNGPITLKNADFRFAKASVNADMRTGIATVGDQIYHFNKRSTFYGTRYSDRIVGNNLSNKIYGGGGHDRIYGKGGNDLIYGGSGNDVIYGDAGRDRIWGQSGSDRIYAGSGNDSVSGGGGHDRIYGQSGSDRLYGGSGNDQIRGGTGNDRIYGQSGRDRMWGQTGRDYCHGGSGRDTASSCERRRAI